MASMTSIWIVVSLNSANRTSDVFWCFRTYTIKNIHITHTLPSMHTYIMICTNLHQHTHQYAQIKQKTNSQKHIKVQAQKRTHTNMCIPTPSYRQAQITTTRLFVPECDDALLKFIENFRLDHMYMKCKTKINMSFYWFDLGHPDQLRFAARVHGGSRLAFQPGAHASTVILCALS